MQKFLFDLKMLENFVPLVPKLHFPLLLSGRKRRFQLENFLCLYSNWKIVEGNSSRERKEGDIFGVHVLWDFLNSLINTLDI